MITTISSFRSCVHWPSYLFIIYLFILFEEIIISFIFFKIFRVEIFRTSENYVPQTVHIRFEQVHYHENSFCCETRYVLLAHNFRYADLRALCIKLNLLMSCHDNWFNYEIMVWSMKTADHWKPLMNKNS